MRGNLLVRDEENSKARGVSPPRRIEIKYPRKRSPLSEQGPRCRESMLGSKVAEKVSDTS